MSPLFLKSLSTTLLCSFLVVSGCSTTRVIDPDSTIHYDASYDFSDKQEIVDHLSQNLVNFVDGSNSKPIVISYGIGNETSEHINTAGISDDIRLALVQSGRYQLINEAQRSNIQTETNFQQLGAVPPSERIVQGRQLGADYILAGTLRSIVKKQPSQIRLIKKKLVHYSLNLELTDTETGAISWADKVEIARESSRPIIGW
ncbi:hypothetical protein AB833_21225 [Chromatiales bacterium (ex Bugula neritina AB1)]|nr:hypothetical protein AB833_21225 [Chromatiales bacterium (ex Bugula neritina AB1)]